MMYMLYHLLFLFDGLALIIFPKSPTTKNPHPVVVKDEGEQARSFARRYTGVAPPAGMT